jgi:Uma2 family endonuclease
MMSTAKTPDLDWDEFIVPPPQPMTEEEFDNWHDELLRGEWVDGKVEFMAPANTEHSEIQNLLLFALSAFVDFHRLGKVWGPEMAVKLPRMRRRRVPDIVFLSQSRLELVEKTFINGAPDLIMEVVSPDSESRDWRKKYQEYERSGVKEYWIIDPASEVMDSYHLTEAGAYEQIAAQSDRIASLVVPGFFVKPDWLWCLPAPQLLELQRELKIIG